MLVILPCGGCFAFLAYMGSVGPETSVYTGNQVPKRFINTMKSVKALDEEEEIRFFYSDGLTDIRDGFYFVSDKKVVSYQQNAATPLTIVQFGEISDLDLFRDESFFEDSMITLELDDGRVVSFPVSSEHDRDQKFFDAIKSSVR